MNRICEKIEEVEKEILRISLNTNNKENNLKKLSNLYKKMLDARKEFLEYFFSQYSLEEIEQIRFSIQEQLLNIKIMIKECLNKDATNEVETMYKLFK